MMSFFCLDLKKEIFYIVGFKSLLIVCDLFNIRTIKNTVILTICISVIDVGTVYLQINYF